AIVLIRIIWRPWPSSPLGIKDPNGKLGCLRDRVERLPMRPECINVRALSANEGSGTADWPLVAPLACFPKDDEDIADHSLGMQQIVWQCVPAPTLIQDKRKTRLRIAAVRLSR